MVSLVSMRQAASREDTVGVAQKDGHGKCRDARRASDTGNLLEIEISRMGLS